PAILPGSPPWGRCSPRPSPPRRAARAVRWSWSSAPISTSTSRAAARGSPTRGFAPIAPAGFYELTAISHIGPALAYLAQVKANGDPRWRARLASLQAHVADVRAANQRAADNWLDRLDQPAWSARKAQIRNMVDYACGRTLDYIVALGDGERFTTAGV